MGSVGSHLPGVPIAAPDDFGLKLTLFLGGLLVLLVLLALAVRWWGRFYRVDETAGTGVARRVLKNSLTPIAANLLNRGIDFAFAIVMLHYLGPEGNGRYAIAAVLVAQYLTTVTDFGLGILTTREVAREPDQANRYLANTTLVRWLLSTLSLPLIPAIIALYDLLQRLGLSEEALHPQSQAALWLLAASLFPAGLAAAISSLFTARERMEVPAFAALLTNVLKVLAGVGVLAAGWGVIGLAGSALLVTTVNALLFLYLQHRLLFRPRLQVDLTLWRWMAAEAFPLMLNNLLLLVFFRFDTFILKPYGGDYAVGAYDAAYKFINATTVVPAYLATALLPLFSRYALESRERLAHTYHLALKVLLLLAFPVAVATSILSEELIILLGGRSYLPTSAVALALLIWFLPLSYVNGITQYVLIAVDRQRTITLAFALAAAVNVGANLIWIPRYGIVAASVITVATEVVLLAPFWWVVEREIGRLPLLSLVWRPALAAAVMALPLAWLRAQLHWTVGLLLALPVYVGVLLLLRTFTPAERELLRRLRPQSR